MQQKSRSKANSTCLQASEEIIDNTNILELDFMMPASSGQETGSQRNTPNSPTSHDTLSSLMSSISLAPGAINAGQHKCPSHADNNDKNITTTTQPTPPLAIDDNQILRLDQTLIILKNLLLMHQSLVCLGFFA